MSYIIRGGLILSKPETHYLPNLEHLARKWATELPICLTWVKLPEQVVNVVL